jgi:hypothetical protein
MFYFKKSFYYGNSFKRFFRMSIFGLLQKREEERKDFISGLTKNIFIGYSSIKVFKEKICFHSYIPKSSKFVLLSNLKKNSIFSKKNFNFKLFFSNNFFLKQILINNNFFFFLKYILFLFLFWYLILLRIFFLYKFNSFFLLKFNNFFKKNFFFFKLVKTLAIFNFRINYLNRQLLHFFFFSI